MDLGDLHVRPRRRQLIVILERRVRVMQFERGAIPQQPFHTGRIRADLLDARQVDTFELEKRIELENRISLLLTRKFKIKEFFLCPKNCVLFFQWNSSVSAPTYGHLASGHLLVRSDVHVPKQRQPLYEGPHR